MGTRSSSPLLLPASPSLPLPLPTHSTPLPPLQWVRHQWVSGMQWPTVPHCQGPGTFESFVLSSFCFIFPPRKDNIFDKDTTNCRGHSTLLGNSWNWINVTRVIITWFNGSNPIQSSWFTSYDTITEFLVKLISLSCLCWAGSNLIPVHHRVCKYCYNIKG